MRCFNGWNQRKNFWSLGLQIAVKCSSDTLSDCRSITCTSFVCSGCNFFLKFQSFMGSFIRMSFITQFKIDFLLSFTGFRKVLGKNDWILLLLLLSPLLLSLLFLIMFVVKHDLGENQFLCYFEQHCLPLLIRSDLFFFSIKIDYNLHTNKKDYKTYIHIYNFLKQCIATK